MDIIKLRKFEIPFLGEDFVVLHLNPFDGLILVDVQCRGVGHVGALQLEARVARGQRGATEQVGGNHQTS